MPLHHVTDFDRPTRLDPAARAAVLAEARAALRDIHPDQNGNIGRSEALAAIDALDGA